MPQESLQQVPLQLYAQQLSDGKWQIVDLTVDGGPKYVGNSLQDAWNAFLQKSPYPAGQIAVTPPNVPGAPTTTWNAFHHDGATLTDWKGQLSLLSLILFVLGLATLPLDGAGAVLLTLSGIGFATTGVLDIINRVQTGTFQWDSETGWDIFNIALAFVGPLGDAADAIQATEIADSVVQTSKAGTVSKMVLLSRGSKALINGYQGILVTIDTWHDIQQVLNSNASAGDKAKQIAVILAKGIAIGTVSLIGAGFISMPGMPLWNKDEAARILAKLKQSGINQRVLDLLEQSPQRIPLQQITQFLDKYGNAADIDKLVQEYDDAIASGKIKSPELGGPTLVDYLTKSVQDPVYKNVWFNRLETYRLDQALDQAKAAGVDPSLLAYIRSDPQMQAIIVNNDYQISQDIQDRWKDWPSTQQRVDADTFAVYLTRLRNVGITYKATHIGGDVPLNLAIDGYDTLSSLDKRKAILALAANDGKGSLSADASAVVDDVLANLKDYTDPAGAALTGSARGDFADAFNQALGQKLASLPLAQGTKLFTEIAGKYDLYKGSIGEWYVYYRYGAAAAGLKRHPTYTIDNDDLAMFDKLYLNRPGLTAEEQSYWQGIRDELAQDVNPDILQTSDGHGLEVKTGYGSGGIDEAQIIRYNLLLQRKQGGLTALNYLFLPGGGTKSALDAAQAAYRLISRYTAPLNKDKIKIYFMDDAGNIRQLDPDTGQPMATPVTSPF